MPMITVDGSELEYERQAKNRSESVFEAQLVVESRTGERSVRSFEIDVSARDDLTAERMETALAEWKQSHPTLTIDQVVVEETKRCGFGRRVGEADAEGASEATAASDDAGRTQPLYRGGGAQSVPRSPVGFGDVPVERGEEVTFHVAGPDSSVYGTASGTVTGVKTGTEDYNVLIIETDSGTKRVREDWVVDESDDETDDAEADADDGDAESDES
ncbi:hypothetical protein [Halosimplex pelagicum]|uniref:Uncharacterized protein n=1 Tax=Halosimplex pelagicum TaxID=869886 RepID=A0A7D5T7A7_9EURY|nr:hypothetical protein [Halosimplex pelagicum]QLH84008.1 hypothetical protein HZS54_21250 [Halosimplex pelagicum]